MQQLNFQVSAWYGCLFYFGPTAGISTWVVLAVFFLTQIPFWFLVPVLPTSNGISRSLYRRRGLWLPQWAYRRNFPACRTCPSWITVLMLQWAWFCMHAGMVFIFISNSSSSCSKTQVDVTALTQIPTPPPTSLPPTAYFLPHHCSEAWIRGGREVRGGIIPNEWAARELQQGTGRECPHSSQTAPPPPHKM